MGKIIIFIMAFIFSGQAFSIEIPHRGKHDKRIRFVDYKSDEVVKLVSHYGYSTHVEFNTNETITNIALGDKKAWDVGPIDNHLFIKAIGNKALTNMTVLTNRRTYNFVLYAHKSRRGAKSNDMMFQIKFRYPEDELHKAKALSDAQKLREKLEKGDREGLAKNWDFWAKGSKKITPNIAYDDGRFTYFSFDSNKDMPAIYISNKPENLEEDTDDVELESLVNSHIDPNHKNTIVVHKLAGHFVLRLGRHVVCVFNKGYKRRQTISNKNATTIKNVKRVIKGKR
ncbi:hypothetical protein [uncultured Gammaproteobacteria bacterium]|uniref:P-type conjugative transfer protein VirB9 n=1 Tax=Bathymodiolus heckerae thiotrophic gill symbiont TaxID=1052212 RepID=UPI0010B575E2|nr:P-type conjugative transfer protein VirB9 [Bathymodiolus heckerae thiotrophic gill symbiont]CAC9955474.1 hypothetical protein [uncultured Gammaproteobacteria bacterium]SHN91361.1 hypothetical protein BHECKSOX_1663 [Bathymodiolus heckerae thiotrophic gill symbiont]